MLYVFLGSAGAGRSAAPLPIKPPSSVRKSILELVLVELSILHGMACQDKRMLPTVSLDESQVRVSLSYLECPWLVAPTRRYHLKRKVHLCRTDKWEPRCSEPSLNKATERRGAYWTLSQFQRHQYLAFVNPRGFDQHLDINRQCIPRLENSGVILTFKFGNKFFVRIMLVSRSALGQRDNSEERFLLFT